jgi:hypothetical protein
MLVIVASRHDATARDLATRWAPLPAAVLTCEDLSTTGWRHHLGYPHDCTAVVAGRVIQCEQITGVLTWRPCILEQELEHIVPADRQYVAAEMNAFLVSWLSSLPCPVLNPPTALCLSGPNWRPEQWIMAAAREHIPVRACYRRVASSNPNGQQVAPVHDQRAKDAIIDITVVGERCFGTDDPYITGYAKRMARAARAPLLGARFGLAEESGPYFQAATLWPNLDTPGVADAIRDYLLDSPVTTRP